MPPRDVACDICGGRFFPGSLPFHRKSCMKTFISRATAGDNDPRSFESRLRDGDSDRNLFCDQAQDLQQRMLEANRARGRAQMLERENSRMAPPSSTWGQEDYGAPTTAPVVPDQYRIRDGGAPMPPGAPRAPGNPKEARRKTTPGGSSASSSASYGRAGKENYLLEGANQHRYAEAAFGGAAASPAVAATGLLPCRVCGRTFAPDRVQKHEAICMKTNNKNKKRRVFNSVARRVPGDGTTMGGGSSLDSGFGFGMPPPVPKRRGKQGAGIPIRPPQNQNLKPKPVSTNWRAKSEALREAIRAARRYSGGAGGMGTWGGGPSSSSSTRFNTNSGSGRRGAGVGAGGKYNDYRGRGDSGSASLSSSSSYNFGTRMTNGGSSSSAANSTRITKSHRPLISKTAGPPRSTLADVTQRTVAINRAANAPSSGGGIGVAAAAARRKTTAGGLGPSGASRAIEKPLPPWGGGGGSSWGRQMSSGGGGGGFSGLSTSNQTSADNPFASNPLMSQKHRPIDKSARVTTEQRNPMILRG